MNFSHGMVTSLGDAWALPAAAGWDGMERGPHSPPPPPLAPQGAPHRPTQDEGLIQLEGSTDPAADLGGLLASFQGVLAGQRSRQLLGTARGH